MMQCLCWTNLSQYSKTSRFTVNGMSFGQRRRMQSALDWLSHARRWKRVAKISFHSKLAIMSSFRIKAQILKIKRTSPIFPPNCRAPSEHIVASHLFFALFSITFTVFISPEGYLYLSGLFISRLRRLLPRAVI